MITGYCLCRQLIQAIGRNAALQEYCLSKFNKQPKFFFAVDENNPPSKDDAPFIMLWQDSKSEEEPISVNRPVGLGCVIKDETVTKDDYIDAAYDGYGTIEEFEALAYAAINCWLQSNESLGFSELQSGDVNFKGFYPHFHSARLMRVITTEGV